MANGGTRSGSVGSWGVGVVGPEGADGLFLGEGVGDGGAGLVDVVPAFAVGGAGEATGTGHFEVAGGVVFANPLGGVAEPLVAVGFGLLGEPGDFVPAPDPELALAGLTGLATVTVVVELDEEGEVFAAPAAGSEAALAAAVDGIGVADAQLGLPRLVGQFLDAEREGMEVEEELALADAGRRGEHGRRTGQSDDGHVAWRSVGWRQGPRAQ